MRNKDIRRKRHPAIKTVKIIILLLLLTMLTLLIIFLVQHELRKDGLPVLGYHSVELDDVYDSYFKDNLYVIKQSEFEKQMKYLSDNGYQTLSMSEAESYYNGELEISEKAVLLTFDDGMENFNTVVKPILEKYNFKGTCFVIGVTTSLKDNGNPAKYHYLKADELESTDNVEYYSHSYNMHRREDKTAVIKLMSEDEIKADFEKNRSIVSDDYFAYPYGSASDNARTYLEHSSVHMAFSYANNITMLPGDDRYYLPRYVMFNHMPLFYFKWVVR